MEEYFFLNSLCVFTIALVIIVNYVFSKRMDAIKDIALKRHKYVISVYHIFEDEIKRINKRLSQSTKEKGPEFKKEIKEDLDPVTDSETESNADLDQQTDSDSESKKSQDSDQDYKFDHLWKQIQNIKSCLGTESDENSKLLNATRKLEERYERIIDAQSEITQLSELLSNLKDVVSNLQTISSNAIYKYV